MSNSFFSSEPFADAAARAFFPRESWWLEDVDVEGRVFRVLRVGRGRIVHDCRFLDYLEPAGRAARPRERARYLRRTACEIFPVERWQPESDVQPAPQIRWSGFESFEAFQDEVKRRSKSTFPTAERKARKLAREVGPLRFVEHTDDRTVLERLFEWKSEQYRRTRLPDLFASQATRALFERLLESGAVQLSALYAGEHLAALHLGPRYQKRFYHWVPTYDPQLQRYAPGNTLNHELMRWSYEAGDDTFDLLLGGEPYKWRYATHVAVVRAAGTPPLRERALAAAHDLGRRALERAPRAREKARALTRALRERELLR